MKKLWCWLLLVMITDKAYCWGFFGHKRINYHAVFLLPPEMLLFFKKHIGFLEEHAVDPDKRRYAFAPEAPRHYIDMDRYGVYPYDSLPRNWFQALAKFGEDSLNAHGIGPWWVVTMLSRLTRAFEEKDPVRILRYAAEAGHYISDLHVPLHTSSNHNGQFTGQKGIHGFWESRIPELLAEKEWDFFIGAARYIDDPSKFIWDRVMESALASDTVLKFEKKLSERFPAHSKYAFEERNGVIIKQYSSAYSNAYNDMLNNMVERRMRQSVHSVASFWFTAWVNAGQPGLGELAGKAFTDSEAKELEEMNRRWKSDSTRRRDCEDL
jgi:hypothetical protein